MIAVKPTMTNKIIAKTLSITRIFSMRAASVTPRESNNAVNIITTAAMMSITPPLLPKVFNNALGNVIPIGAIRPLKLAENPEATKATAIKYSASNAHPATHPKNSPNNTLIHEYADPAKGIVDAISAYVKATRPATIAANRNDKATAGPACSAATTPGRVKMDVETIVPTPNARKSRTRNVR